MSNNAANQGITDFFRVAQIRDFTRNHNFRVQSMVGTGLPNVHTDDLVYAETANLPGRNITNIPTPYMGLDFNLPGLAKYPGSDAYNITFRADGENIIRQLFEDWTRHIFQDVGKSSGDYKMREGNVITLALLRQNGKILRQYKLVGAYPTSCGELAFDMKGNGEVVSFQATIAYQYWELI